jgi:hypothetical protein
MSHLDNTPLLQKWATTVYDARGALRFYMTLRDDVLKTATLLADCAASEQEIVERLVAQGYDVLRAELLMVFVPLGLARSLIARLSDELSVQLADTAVIPDPINNRMLTVKLADVPEFMMALYLGEETFETGIIPREQFGVAISSSVELILINNALDEGKSISGAKMDPPHLLRLADTPGFAEWFQAIKTKMSPCRFAR